MNSPFESDSLFGVHIDDTTKSHLRTAAIWARIIAMVAFVSYGINLIVAFIGKNPTLGDGEYSAIAASAGRTSQIAGALIGAIIGVIINLFLFRFAKYTTEAVDRQSQASLEMGFNGLKVYFKILGIIMLIFLILAGLVLLLVLLGQGIKS
jgi:hypothetical protein